MQLYPGPPRTGLGVALCALALLGLVAAGCGSDDSDDVDAGPTVKPTWSYEGATGPEHWGDLDPDYALCGTGQSQSPIDISPDIIPGTPGDLVGSYGSSKLEIVNDGHTVKVNYDGGSTLGYLNQIFELKQFHFHAGSEHTIGGKRHAMEMHLVHESAAGALTVVGVLIDSGAPNEALAEVFANLPPEPGEPEVIDGVTLEIGSALPQGVDSWRYPGSLTTPDCAEGVNWIVLSTPIEASAEQIKGFTDLYPNSFRPTQPLNGRVVEGQ